MEGKAESRKSMHTHEQCGKTPVRIVMIVGGSAAVAHSVNVCYVRDCRNTAIDFQ